MARVKGGTASINRHKKVLKLSKGYYGRSHSCFRVALGRLATPS
jgi:large subunit ribosomal protein L20